MIDRLLRPRLDPIARDEHRQRVWRRLALCWAVGGAVGLVLLLVGLGAGSYSRFGALLLMAGVGVAALACWLRSRKEGMDYQALARQLEADNPQLHGVLLTAVEQEPDPARGRLSYLQERVIQDALAAHRRQPLDHATLQRLVATQARHWLSFVFFASCLGALLFLSRQGAPAYVAGAPGLSVAPGDTSLERGSSLVVMARFQRRVPSEATLVLQPKNAAERRLPLTRSLSDPLFGASVPEVQGDLNYRIDYDRQRSRTFAVTVFDLPKLERADAKLTFPTYTHLPEKLIPDTRRVSAVGGSTLDYTFYLNKPVAEAKLVAKDKSVLRLGPETNNPSVYHARLTLEQSRRYELLLTDDAGRTNKLPPEFVLEALVNRPPELKLSSPRGDQRVSPLEEIAFEAEVSDDFGLTAYGVAYTLAGQETKVLSLGQNAGAHEKRRLNHLLPLEELHAQPDQLLSYYVWADDFGPDGQVRRATSDLFFAEVRPFDEIFREGQASQGNSRESSGGEEGNPTQKLVELQKQILNATWNLKRRESGTKPSEQYKKDVGVVHQSQEEALRQARAAAEKIEDPRLTGVVELAQKEMAKAATQLKEAAEKNALTPLPPALTSEQAALQALLGLQAREYQVARGRNQRGSGRASQQAQRQVDQLDLKQTENRYETQQEAAPTANPEQREQLQILNRLKELARRQQDVNERLKELQTALQEAKTEQEREEVRRRLKRLREEQQELLADVDELGQRMERPENQSRMAEARRQLEQTRAEVRRAAEALEQEGVPQALASGTRAQRDLQQLQEDLRKKTSGQFTEDMRRMRNDARQLAQKEEEISRKLEEQANPQRKTLSDAEQRGELASELAQQKTGVTNLFTEMRQVSEQSETAEPLLSKQLYDILRQTSQGELDKSIDLSAELLRRGLIPQARQFEQRAGQNLDQLKRGVERAAESVLGDEAEALRMAKRELDALSQQLENELAQANTGTNQSPSAARGSPATDRATPGQGSEPGQQTASAGEPRGGAQTPSTPSDRSPQQLASAATQPGESPEGQGQANPQPGQAGGAPGGQNPANPRPGQAGGARGGQNPANAQPGQATAQQGGGRGDAPAAGANPAGRSGRPNPVPSTARRGLFDRNVGAEGPDAGGGGGDSQGVLTGNEFVGWSDRLRDVEELLDAPELRAEVGQVRDRARAMRLDYKRLGKKPDWAVVRLRIANPLAEVRARVAEELARRDSKDALVPIDRDPVPVKFSELVRRYYERLGKSD